MQPVESDISSAYLRGSSWGNTYGPIAADFPQTNLREGTCCDPWPTCGYNLRCTFRQPRSTGEPASFREGTCCIPVPNLTGVDPLIKRGRGHRPPRQRDGANPTKQMRDMRRSQDHAHQQALLTQINQAEDDDDTFFDFWTWEVLHLRQ